MGVPRRGRWRTTFRAVFNALDGVNELIGGGYVAGGPGDDLIDAGPQNDILDGGPGNDRVSGRKGDDVVTRGDGNDLLTGDRGQDTVDADREATRSRRLRSRRSSPREGNDSIRAIDGQKDIVDCRPGRETAEIDRFDIVRRCEHRTGGS